MVSSQRAHLQRVFCYERIYNGTLWTPCMFCWQAVCGMRMPARVKFRGVDR